MPKTYRLKLTICQMQCLIFGLDQLPCHSLAAFQGMSEAAILWIALCLLLMSLSSTAAVTGGAQFRAMFVFGDSLVDPGNNNNLTTLAKANYKPNGIDFPEGVTGRYYNGGTVVDHLGNLLGFPLIPPYNNPNTTGSKIMRGVNYGSAGSGILNETGHLFGQLFTMNEQIENFRKTSVELRSLVGENFEDYLSKSVMIVSMGSNNYINNYLLPLATKSFRYIPETYAELLQEFGRQLMVWRNHASGYIAPLSIWLPRLPNGFEQLAVWQ